MLAGILALVAAPSAARDVFGLFRGELDPILAVFALCTTLFVVLCAWFAVRGGMPASRARLRRALLGGLALGAMAFAIGFFGPLIWAPEANQGPLLGIFITGPLGFVVGVALGWFVPQRSPLR